jgi:hypothetical protein
MKVLNFTATEVLPGLLKKTKNQTVRPAFCKDCSNTKLFNDLKFKSDRAYQELIMSEHKPRFKVGEIIQLMWKSRTSPKNAWFCVHCGNQIEKCGDFESVWGECKSMVCTGWDGPNIKVKCFPKILGHGKITEIFKIFLQKNEGCRGLKDIKVENGTTIIGGNNDEWVSLFTRDGFNTGCAFEDYFNSHYDLKEAKPFFVYRFEWLK